MSEQYQSLSPIKPKASYKNLKMISLPSPLTNNFKTPNKGPLKRRKSVVVRNTYRLKIKTEEEKENEQQMKSNLFRQADPCDICIDALKINPSYRTDHQIRIISYYLEILKNFMNIFKDQIQNEELEEFLYNISSLLNYENSPKNSFIFKYADKADKFYIILKGKVEFCVPKVNKVYMTEEEYILFLIKLRFNQENELIKQNLENNKISFNYGDNFDHYILRILKKYDEDKESIYSEEIYSYFKKIKELFINKKNKAEDKDKVNQTIEKITIKQYLQRTAISEDIINNNNDNIIQEGKKRILLHILQYEKTNTYQDGFCFGLSSYKKKSYKRSATAISTENCDLAVLDKKLYDQTLDKITKKAKEKLYMLVMSHKLFNQISKQFFNNKYCHMFQFTRFFLNNNILDESVPFDKIIIITSGEFILSVNKNIIELNELIIKIKKLRGNLFNLPEKKIRNDLDEIKDIEDLENTKKYASHSINEYINKRQNLIISTVNDKMILGYPDTIDTNNHLPYFNCKCISTTATGYVVEKEMIKLFKRDGYLRTTPPQIALLKVEFYLRRLIEHKKNIMNRIEFLEEQDKKLTSIKKVKNINNNVNNNNSEKNKEGLHNKISNNINTDNSKDDIYTKKLNKEKNEDSMLNITRNNINPNNFKIKNTFEFQSKKIVDQIVPDNLIPKISSQKNEKENYMSSIKRYENEIKKKKYLLRISQLKSPRFKLKEKIEEKKFQMFLNKYDTKGNYNDFSNIFSKEPNKKASILDKYNKKIEDNVLDPKIYSLKRQINYEKLNLFLPKTNHNSNADTIINTRSNTNTNLDIRDKYIITNPKSETINNLSNARLKNKKRISNDLPLLYNMGNMSEIKKIKINYNNLSLDTDKINDDFNANKLNKTKFKNLYNELYTDYIYNQLNAENKLNKNNSLNKNYQKMDNYRLNKIQLKKIKNKISSPETLLKNEKKDKKEISIVDPLELGNFVDKYEKDRIGNNK